MPSMKKPTQITAFSALYSIAAADGRGKALFGDSFDQAVDFYQRTLIGDGYPIAHLEFPLLGEPCLDLLSVHGKVPLGAKFADGDVAGAAKLQRDTHDLFENLFSEVNPIPVKKAVNLLGFNAGPLRMPLTEMEEAHAKNLEASMRAFGLLKKSVSQGQSLSTHLSSEDAGAQNLHL